MVPFIQPGVLNGGMVAILSFHFGKKSAGSFFFLFFFFTCLQISQICKGSIVKGNNDLECVFLLLTA